MKKDITPKTEVKETIRYILNVMVNDKAQNAMIRQAAAYFVATGKAPEEFDDILSFSMSACPKTGVPICFVNWA